jgi:hypothetical protein
MAQKRWKTMGYIIDFKNESRVFFFSAKGTVSNFSLEKGAVSQKRLGTLGLDNRLTDGGKVVSLTNPAALSSSETLLFLCFWYSFLL